MPFYRALLDAEPAKVKPGYAKFEPDDPGIVLALIEGERGDGLGAFNHGGIKVSSTDEVLATRLRLQAGGPRHVRRDGDRVLLRAAGQDLGHGPGRHAHGRCSPSSRTWSTSAPSTELPKAGAACCA